MRTYGAVVMFDDFVGLGGASPVSRHLGPKMLAKVKAGRLVQLEAVLKGVDL